MAPSEEAWAEEMSLRSSFSTCASPAKTPEASSTRTSSELAMSQAVSQAAVWLNLGTFEKKGGVISDHHADEADVDVVPGAFYCEDSTSTAASSQEIYKMMAPRAATADQSPKAHSPPGSRPRPLSQQGAEGGAEHLQGLHGRGQQQHTGGQNEKSLSLRHSQGDSRAPGLYLPGCSADHWVTPCPFAFEKQYYDGACGKVQGSAKAVPQWQAPTRGQLRQLGGEKSCRIPPASSHSSIKERPLTRTARLPKVWRALCRSACHRMIQAREAGELAVQMEAEARITSWMGEDPRVSQYAFSVMRAILAEKGIECNITEWFSKNIREPRREKVANGLAAEQGINSGKTLAILHQQYCSSSPLFVMTALPGGQVFSL